MVSRCHLSAFAIKLTLASSDDWGSVPFLLHFVQVVYSRPDSSEQCVVEFSIQDTGLRVLFAARFLTLDSLLAIAINYSDYSFPFAWVWIVRGFEGISPFCLSFRIVGPNRLPDFLVVLMSAGSVA